MQSGTLRWSSQKRRSEDRPFFLVIVAFYLCGVAPLEEREPELLLLPLGMLIRPDDVLPLRPMPMLPILGVAVGMAVMAAPREPPGTPTLAWPCVSKARLTRPRLSMPRGTPIPAVGRLSTTLEPGRSPGIKLDAVGPRPTATTAGPIRGGRGGT